MICNVHSVKVQVLLRGKKRTTKKPKTKQKICKSITKYIKTIVEFFVKITNQVFAKHKTPRFSVKLIDKTKR